MLGLYHVFKSLQKHAKTPKIDISANFGTFNSFFLFLPDFAWPNLFFIMEGTLYMAHGVIWDLGRTGVKFLNTTFGTF